VQLLINKINVFKLVVTHSNGPPAYVA